jgi:hypothetical protein
LGAAELVVGATLDEAALPVGSEKGELQVEQVRPSTIRFVERNRHLIVWLDCR